MCTYTYYIKENTKIFSLDHIYEKYQQSFDKQIYEYKL